MRKGLMSLSGDTANTRCQLKLTTIFNLHRTRLLANSLKGLDFSKVQPDP